MTRTQRLLWIGGALLTAAAIVRPMAARSSDDVDPGLVGTWQLQIPSQPIYWAINADGTYQVSVAGLSGHSGTVRAASGKWSMQSPTWGQDGGTYHLPNADTVDVVGRMGPGRWVRTAQSPSAPAAPSQQALSANQAGQTVAGSEAKSARRSAGMTAEEEAAYIADYNAQWDKAARGLRRLTTRAPRSSASGGDWTFGEYSSSGSGDNGAAEAAARAEYEQRAVESRAYWGGSSSDYNRILNGECNSSDNARYGC